MFRSLGHLGPVLFYLPVRTDPDGGPDDPLHELSVHLFLAKRPVCGHHLLIGIGQQGKGEVVLFNKLLMGDPGVG